MPGLSATWVFQYVVGVKIDIPASSMYDLRLWFLLCLLLDANCRTALRQKPVVMAKTSSPYKEQMVNSYNACRILNAETAL